MSIKQHIKDFRQYGWLSVEVKIKSRLMAPIVRKKIAKLPQEAIVIINGAARTVSEVHRVFHLEDKLKILGIPYISIDDNLLERLDLNKLARGKLLFVHRSDKAKTRELMKLYKKQHKTVIYDIDDLVFDPKIIAKISWLKTQNKTEQQEFRKRVELTRSMMQEADFVSTPTKFLNNYIEEDLGMKTLLVRNHVDRHSIDEAEKVRAFNKKRQTDEVVLGYFPGTKTHQKDFAGIEEVLARLLEENRNLKIKIVGDLESVNLYKSRLIKQNRVPYKKLMETYRGVDINLAPLEINEFGHSKSELKYFFAGLVGIPTVASKTATFADVISPEENGYLATTKEDWYEMLNKLIKNKKLREKLGRNANEQVMREYTPEAQAKQIMAIVSK